MRPNAGGLPRPGGEEKSSPGQELLGVSSSHGPSRESYHPPEKSIAAAEAEGPPAAGAAVSVERLRAALPSAAGSAALLQPALRRGGETMDAVAGAATIPVHRNGQAEAERPMPALPRTRPHPQAARHGDCRRTREGNRLQVFSRPAATGPAATKHSRSNAAARCNTSVHGTAGARSNGSGNGKGAGNSHGFKPGILIHKAHWPYSQPCPCNWSYIN
jgi:hypothetical protein